MNRDIIQILKAEAAELRRKLEAVEQVIAVYGGEFVAPLHKTQSANVAPSIESASSKSGEAAGQSGRKRAAHVEFTVQFLVRHLQSISNAPQSLSDLYKAAVAAGCEIRGMQPKSTLSALLSNDPQFTNEGRVGWRLTEYKKSPAYAGPSEIVGAVDGSRPQTSDLRADGSIPSASTPISPEGFERQLSSFQNTNH